MWSKEEKERFSTEYAMDRHRWKDEFNDVQNYAYEQENADLGAFQNRQLELQLYDDQQQRRAYEATYNPDMVRSARTESHSILYNEGPNRMEGVRKCQLIAKQIQEFTPQMLSELLLEDPSLGIDLEAKRRYELQERMEAREAKFDADQKEIYEVYYQYLRDPYDPQKAPPPIVLLDGEAGTGKGHVLQNIIDLAELENIKVFRTAFNAINAIALDGVTMASVIYFSSNMNLSETFAPGKKSK